MEKSIGTVEAVLLTGGLETPYRRAGNGPPILLLADSADLFEALSRSFRVIQPLRTPGNPQAPGWPRWLQGVVDGLGLQPPAVVADSRFVGAARRLAVVDPDRIGAVVEAGPRAWVLAQLGGTTENIDV